jgi:hypothetical protein
MPGTLVAGYTARTRLHPHRVAKAIRRCTTYPSIDLHVSVLPLEPLKVGLIRGLLAIAFAGHDQCPAETQGNLR